ncbi:DMT family transporter [Paraglaciecola agarilytica]|uniref:DMT family transporter n=1 Tax=Paraglaciecola chathamensis TaxID=368405 RepID=UPI001C08E092|nr:DMT family transporter [Paraglaciecola agarilytica]MBU3019209.1 DMT family transporter [Paraglaciecola agarilytica]
MDPVKKSLWSLHLTVILLGATALFSKVIPLSATDITFGRSIVACLALFTLVKMNGGKLTLARKKDYFIGIGLGLLMAAHWVSYFAAMQYSSVSVGMIALFTFPVITVLIEPFFEGIRLVWQDILSALVVLIGIFLIVPEVSLQNDVTLGILVGVTSAVLYAFRNVCHRKYFSHYSGSLAMAYQTLVIFFCLSFFISPDLFDASGKTYVYLALLGTFFTAVPHALIATSLQHLRAKTFSLVACMQPLYGVILAIIVLDEQPNWQTYVGGLLVISAALYETVNTQKLHKK